MTFDVAYRISPDGLGIIAECAGRRIGEITFVRVGMNKLVIEHTAVDAAYRGMDVGLNLVRRVCDMARAQNRRIVPLCPFARAVFCRHPEFDDVRVKLHGVR